MSAPKRRQKKVKVKTVTQPITREQTIDYNKLGFLAPVMIVIIDNLKESPYYKQGLKNSLNLSLTELERLTEAHFKSYETYGKIPNPEGGEMEARDIYNNTSKGYDAILSRPPSEVAQIAELVRRFEADGNKISDIETYYFPVEKSKKELGEND